MDNKIIYLKNNILEVLKTSKYPLSSSEILEKINLEFIEENNDLKTSLAYLKNNRIISENIYNKFSLKNTDFLIGKINVNKKGFGFIKINAEDKSYYVHQKNINTAFNNDEVLFVLVNFFSKVSNENIVEAKVIKVLKRNTDNLVGIVKISKQNKKYLIIKSLPLLNKTAKIENPENLKNNSIVLVKLIKAIQGKYNKTLIFVKVIKTLGKDTDIGIDILSVVNEFNLPYIFNSEVKAEESKIPEKISNYDLDNLKNRKNLLDELLVTIDGATAKDLDDAIRVKKLPNGNYNLLVSIADVSYYVEKDSAIDLTALKRGSSAYLIDRVIPMLPKKLSNGICSLNPDEYRFCLSIEMEIDKNGNTINSNIFQGLMRSKARLTYDAVNELFKSNVSDKIDEKLQKMLFEAKELYAILLKYKKIRGMITLDLNEPEFELDKEGKVINIKNHERFDAEKLIESFMIRANEEVATIMTKKKVPFIYRVHPKPKDEKLNNLWNQLSILGIDLRNYRGEISAKSFQSIIKKLESYENNQLTLNIFLRSMEKAVYSQKNDGHFGLVSEFYTHFTSPIRRYPDLLVHRLIKECIIYENKSDKTLINFYKKHIQSIAEQSTENEIKIMDCEREVHKLKKAEYMSQFIGKQFDGLISAVTNFGFFVVLENTVEGMIHISDLTDDHYVFDEKAFKLIGKQTNNIYSVGQKVKIEVKNADKETRIIDFTLVK